MGYSVSAAFAIVVLAGLISLNYVYTSIDYVIDRMAEGYDFHVHYGLNRLDSQIDVAYINATQQGLRYDLRVKVYNSGSVTIESSKIDYVVNGTLTSPDSYDKSYLLPGKNLTVDFYNLSGSGKGRLKVVTEYGNSAYKSYEVL